MKFKWPNLKIGRADVERLLVLCAAALVVVLAIRNGQQEAALYEEPYDGRSVSLDGTSLETVETISTVVYYADGEGYLIPVTRSMEKTEGVARATLALMVSSAENDLAAARLGLKTVVPAGTQFDLDISGGKARLDMSGEALTAADAEQEALMVHAVVCALCEFDTVSSVEFLFNGQKRSKLTHGTDVSGVLTAEYVNLESASASVSADAHLIQVYFPSSSGRMLVPVSRVVYSDADMETALLELLKGPRPDSGLETPLPKDCGLKGVTIQNGTVTIDFTRSFLTAMEADTRRQTLRAVLFTASQFPGVKKVKLTVEGQPYTPPEEDAATFLNHADDIMTQYPGVIELD